MHPGHIRFAEAGLWKRGGARDAAAKGWLVEKAEEGRCEGRRSEVGVAGDGGAGVEWGWGCRRSPHPQPCATDSGSRSVYVDSKSPSLHPLYVVRDVGD